MIVRYRQRQGEPEKTEKEAYREGKKAEWGSAQRRLPEKESVDVLSCLFIASFCS